AQVLAHGEDLHTVLPKDPERVDQLLEALPETHHQARLGHDAVAAHLLREAQYARGANEVRAAARNRVQARNRLDVVVEDVRSLVDDLGEGHLLTAEVRRQNLHPAVRGEHADRADDAYEGAGAVVGQVVAIDGRDDRVAKAHALHLR